MNRENKRKEANANPYSAILLFLLPFLETSFTWAKLTAIGSFFARLSRWA